MFNFIKKYKAKSKLYCGLANKEKGEFDKALKCLDESLVSRQFSFGVLNVCVIFG